MPITPLDAITFANQNMQVAASKQNDYRNRIEQQKYVAMAKAVAGKEEISGLDELTDDQKIDGEREHNRQEAQDQAKEQSKDANASKQVDKAKAKVSEEKPPKVRHILDIKV
jgi:hypothetical protein